MDNHHDIRLPNFLAEHLEAVCEFSTSKLTMQGGEHFIKLNNPYARHKYYLRNCRLNDSQFEEFQIFFKARRGRYFSFRLQDFADYKSNKQVIGIGNGINKEFKLTKIYDDGFAFYERKINLLNYESLELYNGGERILAFSFDQATSIISLPEVLKEKEQLIATFTFDVKVRFNSDSYKYVFNRDGSISLEELEIEEVF